MATSSELMRKLRDETGLTVDEFISAVSKHHPTAISRDTINKWLNHEKIVQPGHRKAFSAFVRKMFPPDEAKAWLDQFHVAWQSQAVHAKPHNSRLLRHHKWVSERYATPIMGEKFSLAKIYVPIKLTAYGMRSGIEEMDQVFTDKDLIDFGMRGFHN